MVEVGRALWSPSGPSFLLKQGHLEQAAQDHIQIVSVVQSAVMQNSQETMWVHVLACSAHTWSIGSTLCNSDKAL